MLMQRVPSVPGVMLFVMGLFQVLAACVTFIPSLGHDRVPQQFIPVWRFLLRPLLGPDPGEAPVKFAAVGSQYIIGITEAVIGVVLLGAALNPSHRLGLANLGLGLSTGLFGAFLLTLFAMHDKNLPQWNQYPAILGWIAATWLVVNAWERARPNARTPG